MQRQENSGMLELAGNFVSQVGDPSRNISSDFNFAAPEPIDQANRSTSRRLIVTTLADGTQLVKNGKSYFQDFWNYVDIIHVIGGYINILATPERPDNTDNYTGTSGIDRGCVVNNGKGNKMDFRQKSPLFVWP